MNIRRSVYWAGPVFLLLAGACAPQAMSAAPQAEEAAAEDGELDPDLQKLVSQATADLGQRLEIAEGDVELLRAERVTWRDSSLGCPEPGMVYMQALQPGVLIELGAGGQVYRYHSTPEGPPFYCEHPSPKEPLPAEPEQ